MRKVFVTNLGALREVSDGDFEWFQHSHGSGRRVVQHVPHTRLQEVGLCRRLGNGDSDLPTDVTCHYTTAEYSCV